SKGTACAMCSLRRGMNRGGWVIQDLRKSNAVRRSCSETADSTIATIYMSEKRCCNSWNPASNSCTRIWKRCCVKYYSARRWKRIASKNRIPLIREHISVEQAEGFLGLSLGMSGSGLESIAGRKRFVLPVKASSWTEKRQIRSVSGYGLSN